MKNTITFSLLLTAIAVLIFSCENLAKKETSLKTEKHEVTPGEKKDCDDVHWSHHAGAYGPENWKNLCDGFADCEGQAQSPINIITDETIIGEELSALKIKYGPSKVDIINNGHTVQFNTSGNNAIMIGDKEYKLLQFHFHTNSEHAINGNYFPIEVHFVHKYSDTDYAVLGLMFQEGEANELFTKYLSNFPETQGTFVSDEMIELEKLLPANLSYYHYSGSLTTPPCSEVVSWYVVNSPLDASIEQIEIFSKILNNNFRPIMPLNKRNVLSYDE